MLTHRVRYTSMRCYRESDEWSFSDEVYAIFVSADWQCYPDKPLWLNVEKTRTYEDVDAGETKGAYDLSDNRRIWGDQGAIGWSPLTDHDKQLILVQAMEHDSSHPDGMVKALKSVMEARLKTLLMRNASRAQIVSAMKKQLRKTISQTRELKSNVFSDKFCDDLRDSALHWFLANPEDPFVPVSLFVLSFALSFITNADDFIGEPKPLVSVNDVAKMQVQNLVRKSLVFSSGDEGTKAFRFSLERKIV